MDFLEHVSPDFLEAQQRRWREDPRSLPFDWQAFFQGMEFAGGREAQCDEAEAFALALKQSGVQSLIDRYRDVGHLHACTDPLTPCALSHPLLELSAFGLAEEDLDRSFVIRRFLDERATLREVREILQETYCRTIGVEFMHIQDPAMRTWLIERMEPARNRAQLSGAQRLAILTKLQEATLFESFLHKKFLGQKRFSLEGGEVIIPLLDALVESAAAAGVSDLVMGMAHRGRLNVLANIFGKPLANIFAEFQDNLELAFVGEGDVKYHKGFSADRRVGERTIHLSLASNPSHLEAVNPVVIGKCRARHSAYGPGGRQRVLPVLIHGDAAFAGQGIVAEVLNLSQLDGYQTGGTVHLVLNNQIGFTTEPVHARSTLYATDVAKMLSVPIFHINGEDPEAAVYAARLALEYRQTFARDVVIEVICYRRHGHNEGDEPNFTQPLMYDRIRQRPPLHEIYGERLREEGVAAATIAAGAAAIEERLAAALSAPPEPEQDLGFRARWEQVARSYLEQQPDTRVPAATLLQLARRLSTLPAPFNAHPKMRKLLERRRETVEAGAGIDWGTAEALAFASLLVEQVPVRLSGQDCRRGTFNQRHAALVDQHNGQLWFPLAFLEKGQAPIQIYNSMLSEAAVLGFEYGYSLETPQGLTIWEAQFGDFANGAQVIIDQFIASGASKWDRSSGLVLFLPHGYEGQGPEHSSARIERFLALCAGNNLQVAYPSTPAQLFHLLRRQMKLSFRRPLIVFTPKSLLRHPGCVATLAELAEGGFHPLLLDPCEPSRLRTLLACSGKLYHELAPRLAELQRDDLALLRIEQLYPLDGSALADLAARLPATAQLAWVQEEPQNMGAWSCLAPQLASLFGRPWSYIGRPAAAAPAVGSHRRHQQEQQELIQRALQLATAAAP